MDELDPHAECEGAPGLAAMRSAPGVHLSMSSFVRMGRWRVARGGRIHCEIPTARLDAAWSRHDDPQRQAISRAFQPAAARPPRRRGSVFRRRSTTMSARMVRDVIEACQGHAVPEGSNRRKCSSLRMRCLTESLDEVRALSHVLSGADATPHFTPSPPYKA